MLVRRAINWSSGMFISPAAWIGPSACSSSVASRPSHMKIPPQAALTTVGEWRPSLFMP
jgi:hypothetical protein